MFVVTNNIDNVMPKTLHISPEIDACEEKNVPESYNSTNATQSIENEINDISQNL